MQFSITIVHNRKAIKLAVFRVFRDDYTERYMVTDNNNKYVVERTLPLYLHVALKPTSTWRLVEPSVLVSPLRNQIINALKKVIE